MFKPKLNYVPGEWEHQDGVLLTWPRSDGDWSGLWQRAIAAFTQLAAAIARFEPVLIICPEANQIPAIESALLALGTPRNRFHCCQVASDDTWTRDFGPISRMQMGRPRLLNFQFNAWGDRYGSAHDNAINDALKNLNAFAAPLDAADFILEGGSIESDGNGALLTTSRCLLSEQRNSSDRAFIETQLKQWLPIERVLWLDSGYLAGDDTDSHIDNLARFADADTLLYAQCRDAQDEHYAPLQAMQAELQALRNVEGKPYRLLPLPLPQPAYSVVDQRRLAASYLNFLILNGAVLAPVFDDPADREVLATLAAAFPGREIVGIDGRTFIEQNGGVHCLTMQLTAGTLNPALFTTTVKNTAPA
jgi:agmatine/peptidylarginine deiminase